MAKKHSIVKIKQRVKEFCNCKTIQDLSYLLKVAVNQLQLYALDPMYIHFEIPKKKGGKRQIEAPNDALKKVQRKVNEYLQALYYLIQPQASFGYIISVKGEAFSKNIQTNAITHYGNDYLLNIDFKDFFHQIHKQHVYKLFISNLFSLDKRAASLLTSLCTRLGRLPMGAPTSPVLSNLCTLDFDKAMAGWTKKQEITYTRFVDDLSFSSKMPLHPNNGFLKQVKNICKAHHLEINEQKINYYPRESVKVITGLLLDDPIGIPNEFYVELKKDMQRLKHFIEIQQITGVPYKTQMMNAFKKQIEGQLNFIGMIEGYQSNEYLNHYQSYTDAQRIDDEIFYKRWTHFSYF